MVDVKIEDNKIETATTAMMKLLLFIARVDIFVLFLQHLRRRRFSMMVKEDEVFVISQGKQNDNGILFLIEVQPKVSENKEKISLL